MASANSGLSLEFHSPQRVVDPKVCVHPTTSGSKSLCGQLRYGVVQETPYLDGKTRRECFSTKDATKRKRVNRVAKLKQCKLDARREQWLSQGRHCRLEADKQVAQNFDPNEEKQGRVENLKSGKYVLSRDAACRLKGVIGEFLNEENVITKKKDARFCPSPHLVGSAESPSNIVPTLKALENGRPELLSGASQDDIDKTKRRSPDRRCALDLEERQEEITNHQISRDVTGSIHCATSSDVPHLVCFRSSTTQMSTESEISKLNVIPRESKFHDGDAVGVVKRSGQRNVCSPGCGNDQLFRSGSPCISDNTVPDKNDRSFTHENEDDWEVAADALYVSGSSVIKDASQLSKPASEGKELIEQKEKISSSSNFLNGVLQPAYKAVGFGIKSRGVGGRAWRPDDISRPQTLPQLLKHVSCPRESSTSTLRGLQQVHNVWGPPPVRSYCPICTEELDLTDSSFCPCSCGFRLCLFCHHRISSDDGRCPGCRKPYSPDDTMKLSRATPFWLRV